MELDWVYIALFILFCIGGIAAAAFGGPDRRW